MSYSTTDIKVKVKSRVQSEGLASLPPTTVPKAFKATAERLANELALVSSTDVKYTYRDYYNNTVSVAKSFIKLGLDQYQSVNIIGFNSPEYHFSFAGCIFAGGISCGVYATNTPSICKEALTISNGIIIVCDGQKQFDKYISIKDEIHLKAIIIYNYSDVEIPSDLPFPVYKWDEFVKLGRDVSDDALNQRIERQDPFQCCNLVMTSGTTGAQKAVMISHDNMIFSAYIALYSCCSIHNEVELKDHPTLRMVSYLPLSHVAAQLVDMFVGYVFPVELWFARPDALKGTLVDTLKKCLPNVVMGVPRVWEKMYDKIKKNIDTAGGIKGVIARWAYRKGQLHRDSLQYNSDVDSIGCYGMADSLMIKKVKGAIGFDKILICITSAAPIDPLIIKFLSSFDLPLYELLGASEATGPICTNSREFWKIGSVGPACKGVHVKLAENTGEILFSGRNVFMGYKDNSADTNNTIDKDGYVHCGDIGEIDGDGFYTVKGRIKEILITAGGENISPLYIEDKLKMLMPCLSQCITIGNEKKFLSVLLTLKNMPNSENYPTNDMSPDVLELANKLGSIARTLSDASNCSKFNQYISDNIKIFNDKYSISNAQQIRKWKLLPRDFGINTGELTPTMKMKRKVIYDIFKKEIDEIYRMGSDNN